MKPHHHAILGALISIILYPFFDWWLIALFLFATVFIDTDHFLIYIFMKRDFSLRNAYSYFSHMGKKHRAKEFKGKKEYPLLIFHNYEFILLLFAASFFYYPLFFVLLGILVHLIADVIYNPRDSIQRMGYLKSWSIAYRLSKQHVLTAEIKL